jgi:hypothetical protein
VKLTATARRSRRHADIGPVDEVLIPMEHWKRPVDDLGNVFVHHKAKFRWER